MTETAVRPTEAPAPGQKTKVEKAQNYLGVVSTSIGVVGALGTAFVWLATTYFTGELAISPDKPVEEMMVKVIDSRGHQQIYYTRYVSLMPGDYHIEYGVADKKPTVHADAHVNVWQRTIIPYVVPEELAKKEEAPTNKKWWQFWRKGNGPEAGAK